MAGEWGAVPIGELAEIYDGPHATPPKTSEGPVFLGISNLAKGRIDLANSEHLSEDDYTRWTRRVEPKAGDVVFSYETRLGEAAIIPWGLRCCLGRRMGLLRARPGKVDRRFLLYAYLGPKFQEILRSRTIHGSTVDRIPLIDMPSFPIEVPACIDEQRAIAHILGTLDDKIELNRRMNETLEAMARALFKSWFVDFGPVRAKAEGRNSGLPKPLADLFPARLVDSELGEIPEGWEVGCVDDEFDLTMGQSPPGESYNETGEGLPFYQGRADFGSRFPTRRVYCTAPTRLAKAGDTLISVRAPVGDINMATEECAIGRGVAAARHKSRSRSYSYQFMLGLEEVFGRFEAEGTVFGSIGKKDFHAISCARPPREVVAAFEAMLAPIDSRIDLTEHESRTLAGLRDALLPKLISGALQVRDAGSFLRRASV